MSCSHSRKWKWKVTGFYRMMMIQSRPQNPPWTTWRNKLWNSSYSPYDFKSIDTLWVDIKHAHKMCLLAVLPAKLFYMLQSWCPFFWFDILGLIKEKFIKTFAVRHFFKCLFAAEIVLNSCWVVGVHAVHTVVTWHQTDTSLNGYFGNSFPFTNLLHSQADWLNNRLRFDFGKDQWI